MKKIKNASIISVLLIRVFTSLTFAGWLQEGSTWKYEENGAFKTNAWLSVDGDNYYFDGNGNMVTGLTKIGQYYYMFHKNGKAYTKKEHFNYNDIEYDISSKGKVKDLELDMNDEQYNSYVSELAIEEANNKAFADAQKAMNESIAKEVAKREEEQKAIRESQKAESAAAQAIINESKKARQEYLLSAENEEKIIAAANLGNSSKSVVNNIKVEIRGQLNDRRKELIDKAKALRAANPLAEISPIVEDYKSIVNAYANRIDSILSATAYKYKVGDEKMDKYSEELVMFLDEMINKFEAELEKELG